MDTSKQHPGAPRQVKTKAQSAHSCLFRAAARAASLLECRILIRVHPGSSSRCIFSHMIKFLCSSELTFAVTICKCISSTARSTCCIRIHRSADCFQLYGSLDSPNSTIHRPSILPLFLIPSMHVPGMFQYPCSNGLEIPAHSIRRHG